MQFGCSDYIDAEQLARAGAGYKWKETIGVDFIVTMPTCIYEIDESLHDKLF